MPPVSGSFGHRLPEQELYPWTTLPSDPAIGSPSAVTMIPPLHHLFSTTFTTACRIYHTTNNSSEK